MQQAWRARARGSGQQLGLTAAVAGMGVAAAPAAAAASATSSTPNQCSTARVPPSGGDAGTSGGGSGGGGSGSTPQPLLLLGAAPSQPIILTIASFAVTKLAYVRLTKLFREMYLASHGGDVRFRLTFAGSGVQVCR